MKLSSVISEYHRNEVKVFSYLCVRMFGCSSLEINQLDKKRKHFNI